MNESKLPALVEAMAATLNEEQSTLVEVVEPYLLKIGFLARTPSGRRARIYYATQTAIAPPTIVLFVNDKRLMATSYESYIVNKYRAAHPAPGQGGCRGGVRAHLARQPAHSPRAARGDLAHPGGPAGRRRSIRRSRSHRAQPASIPQAAQSLQDGRPGRGRNGAAPAAAEQQPEESAPAEDVLDVESIVLAGTATTRDGAIGEAGRLLVACGAVEPAYVEAMYEREGSVSTYMGNGLAIPHGTNDAKSAIKRTGISFVRYPEPIDWNGKPAEFVVINEPVEPAFGCLERAVEFGATRNFTGEAMEEMLNDGGWNAAKARDSG